MSIHDGHRQRLKDRYLAEGLDHFNELQVLELLLFYCIPRQDTNPIAHALLDRFGSISQVLDAPVSGGVAGAKAGTMTMLCAGSKETLDRVTPVLEHISGTRCYIGSRPGQGKIVKSLNNLLNAVNKAAVGEAWQMAEAHGIDPDAFSEAISASSGGSYAFRTTFPRIKNSDYTPAFTVALMRKDVGLALNLAEGKHLPLSETTLQYYELAREFDGEDSSAVTKVRFPACEE